MHADRVVEMRQYDYDEMVEEREKLKSLCLEMGNVIRSLDEKHEHLELWTQDGDYIIDGRFPDNGAS